MDVFNTTDIVDPLSTTPLGSNYSTFDLDLYLETQLGKRHEPIVTLVLLTVTYVVIFVTGVSGNVFTCVVIAKNRAMHTATNYYLFSLAVSDLATLLLALPPDMYSLWEAYPWRFGTIFCYLKSYITEITAHVSVLTIVAFTVERYFAICHPMQSQKFSQLSRVSKIVLAIWIVACLCALPYPLHSRMYYYAEFPENTSDHGKPIPESLICGVPLKFYHVMQTMFQVSTFLFFVAPMTIITILYVLIGQALRRSGRGGVILMNGHQRQHSTGGTSSKTRRGVFRMLVAVVIAFFLCWAPYHAQRLMTIYIKGWTPLLLEIQTHIFYLSGVLYMFNSTVNPILYNVMSKRFRLAFKQTLCSCFDGPVSWDANNFRFSTVRSNSSTYSNLRHAPRDKRAKQVAGSRVSNF